MVYIKNEYRNKLNKSNLLRLIVTNVEIDAETLFKTIEMKLGGVVIFAIQRFVIHISLNWSI